MEAADSGAAHGWFIACLVQNRHVRLTVVISAGKSFLACALGEHAGSLGYKVKFYMVRRLLDELKLARQEGHELKSFEKIKRLDLLIVDDFGMRKLEGQQQNDFER